jgi:hypothetical protein
MMGKISRQTLYEALTMRPVFTNLEGLRAQLMKMHTAGGAEERLSKASGVPANLLAGNQRAKRHYSRRISRAIEEMDAADSVRALTEKLGLSSFAIVERNPAYDSERRRLVLKPEGALAAAIFAYYFPEELAASASKIKELIAGLESGKNELRTPREVATALFFLHLATHGTRAALTDLSLSDHAIGRLSSEITEGGRLPLGEISDELAKVQLNYLNVLYLGRRAILHE